MTEQSTGKASARKMKRGLIRLDVNIFRRVSNYNAKIANLQERVRLLLLNTGGPRTGWYLAFEATAYLDTIEPILKSAFEMLSLQVEGHPIGYEGFEMRTYEELSAMKSTFPGRAALELAARFGLESVAARQAQKGLQEALRAQLALVANYIKRAERLIYVAEKA